MLVHAVSSDHHLTAHGSTTAFTMGGAESYEEEGEGPVITAWLDDPSFIDGDPTSPAPLLHAELYDEDGINVAGSGIGHDVELVVDGLMRYTYDLNEYFRFDFGDYRSGSIDFQLPLLAEGHHELQLRAWDVLNHSSVLHLTFAVGPQYSPSGISELMHNAQCEMHDEVYDLQGRRVTAAASRQLLIQRDKHGRMKKKLYRKQ